MNTQEQKKIFQKTVERHKGILYKVAHSYCSNEEDRQDLIQEMMIQIWQSIHKYNGKYKISTWLYRICLNVAISDYRKNAVRERKNTEFFEQNTQILLQENNDTERDLNLLEHFISELNEIDKALIILYLENKTHNEIADIIGISSTNVGTKIGRIKVKLNDRFSQVKNQKI